MKGKTSPNIQEFDVEHEPSFLKIYLASFSALLFMLIAGMMASYPAPATVDMKNPGSRFIGITPDEITWIGSLPTITGAISTVLGGFACDMLGRKAVLIYSTIPGLLGWLMIVYAPTIGWIYAGRLLTGINFGLVFVAVPAYVVEVAPVKIRGLLTAGFQLSFSSGVLVMMMLGWGLRWSWLAAAGAVINVMAMILIYFMPESPAWLLQKSRKLEATDGLKFLLGKDIDTETELQNIAASTTTEKYSSSVGDLKKRNVYMPLLLSVGLFFFQQFSGTMVLSSYTVEIFQNTGSPLDANSSAVVFAGVQVVMSVISSLLMDRAGRRPLFMISAAIVSATLCGLGIFCYVKSQGHEINNFTWIPFTCLIGNVAFYSIGLGPVPLSMASELISVQFRSMVLTITITIACALTFLITKSFDFMVSNAGYYGLFWTFSGCSFLGVLYGWFCLPETKGRTLDDINSSFLKS